MDELREKIGSKIDVVLKRVIGNVYPAIIRTSLTNDIMDLLKPADLVWGKTSYGSPECITEVKIYRIVDAPNGGYCVSAGREILRTSEGLTNFPNEDSAKDAAQAHYNRMMAK